MARRLFRRLPVAAMIAALPLAAAGQTPEMLRQDATCVAARAAVTRAEAAAWECSDAIFAGESRSRVAAFCYDLHRSLTELAELRSKDREAFTYQPRPQPQCFGAGQTGLRSGQSQFDTAVQHYLGLSPFERGPLLPYAQLATPAYVSGRIAALEWRDGDKALTLTVDRAAIMGPSRPTETPNGGIAVQAKWVGEEAYATVHQALGAGLRVQVTVDPTPGCAAACRLEAREIALVDGGVITRRFKTERAPQAVPAITARAG